MRILLVNDFLEKLGGGEQVVQTTKELLKESGHHVLLYAPSGHRSVISSLFSIKHYVTIHKIIKTYKPDIVHVHNIYRNVSPSVVCAARVLDVPVVMTLHDFHLVCPKTSLIDENHLDCKIGLGHQCLRSKCYPRTNFNHIYQGLKTIKLSLHRFLLRRTVNQFLAPSLCLMNWVKKNFGTELVALLPHPIISEHTDAIQTPVNKSLLYVGRLTEQKGVDVLIKAISKIRDTVPDIKLKIIGGGDYEQKLKKLVDDLHLLDHIVFTGVLSNQQVQLEYNLASLVIIPSKYIENLPVVGVEAISRGKVVIASRIGGLPDLVDDNETGLLFLPGNPDDLAGKILYALRHQEILPAMGALARIKYFRSFSKSAYYRTLLTVYDRTIRETRNRNSQL